jgi:hypothetical protein
LLIGCDFYFPNRLPNGATYESLGGCVHDIDRIVRLLRERITAPITITRLAASRGDGKPPEPAAEWPTATNLRAAFESLIASVQSGDQIYIFYSGHGGRAVTAYKDLKGTGAMDEALVPIDIGGGPGIHASRYLRDVELAGLVTRIASRIGAGSPGGGTLTLSFDSCHAGGTLRGMPRVALRCATGGDGTLDTTPAVEFGEDEVTAEAKRAWAELKRNAGAVRSAVGRWLPPSDSYVLLAACSDTQSAIESTNEDGRLGGVMTDAFLEALHSLTGKPSWLTVYNRVLAHVQARFASQTPQLLGDPRRQVFGTELKPIRPFAPVLEVDPVGQRVRVGTGLATMVEPGVELGIFRPDTLDFSLENALVACATVTTALATECWAALDPSGEASEIELGAPAVVLKIVLQRKVALFRRPAADLPPTVAAHQEVALSALAQALAVSGRGFVVEATNGTMPDYHVVLNERGEYEVWDPRGDEIPRITPALRPDPSDPTRTSAIAAQVVDRLLRLCRYQTVLDLRSPVSELDRTVEIELLGGPLGWTEWEPIPKAQQLSLLVSDTDTYRVKHQQAVFIRVTNHGSQAVNVGAVDLSPDWAIGLLIPTKETGAASEVVGAGETRVFPIIVFVPPGFESTLDVIKVFAAVGNAPFPCLEQPALDQPFGVRGARRWAGSGALARLFDAFDADTNRTRAVRPAMSRDLAWTVATFRLQVT